MTIKELMEERKALMASVAEYKTLDNESRTDEKRTENRANMDRIKQIDKDVEELKEIEELEARDNEVVDPGLNTPDSQRVEVEDQPIYRGNTALGQQMVDIANLARNSGDVAEARSRCEQVYNREVARAESRAAGTGGMVQAVSADGGILLQGETSMDMIQHGFNNSAVLSRCANRDIGTNQYVDLIGLDETSRVNNSRLGGIRVYTDAELEQMTQSKTKFDKIRLQPEKLTGMYYASDEILANAPLLTGEMDGLFREEFAFKAQDLVIRGSGAGEALGLANADCLVSVAKESGQAATTVVFENLVKMKARMRLRNRQASVWIANQDVEPQLFQLSLPVGTGGSVMPVYIPSQNQNDGVAGSLLGIPIVFIEQCETLGTKNDIMLCDFSMYYAANKGGIDSASSMHLKFDYNQTAFRFITFFDGQPRLKNAITPYKGSNTVSPFVTLATRS